MLSEILNSLAFVSGRTEQEYISIYPGSCESVKESQGKTAEAYFLPEQMRENSQNHGEDQGLHERLAELL